MDNKKIFLKMITVPSEKPDPNIDTEDLMDETFELYKMKEIIGNINNKNFKNVYLVFKNDIIEKPFEQQRDFLIILIEEILKMYGLNFSREFYINDNIDLKNAYDFIEFFMFGYIDFYAKIWNELVDWSILNDININDYIMENPRKFLDAIEKTLYDNQKFLPLLYINVMYYCSGAKLLETFIKFSEMRKNEIILSLVEMTTIKLIKGER